jgi:hypothetical protein
LLVRIHAARQETADAGRCVTADMEAANRSWLSLQTGLKILNATLAAAGVMWSLNAASRITRGRRLFTTAVSLLSSVRAMRRVSGFLMTHSALPER